MMKNLLKLALALLAVSAVCACVCPNSKDGCCRKAKPCDAPAVEAPAAPEASAIEEPAPAGEIPAPAPKKARRSRKKAEPAPAE